MKKRPAFQLVPIMVVTNKYILRNIRLSLTVFKALIIFFIYSSFDMIHTLPKCAVSKDYLTMYPGKYIQRQKKVGINYYERTFCIHYDTIFRPGVQVQKLTN